MCLCVNISDADEMYTSLDAVFCENSEPRSLEDKQKRAKKTFEEMLNYIPGWTCFPGIVSVNYISNKGHCIELNQENYSRNEAEDL